MLFRLRSTKTTDSERSLSYLKFIPGFLVSNVHQLLQLTVCLGIQLLFEHLIRTIQDCYAPIYRDFGVILCKENVKVSILSPYHWQCGDFGVSFSDSAFYLCIDPVSLRSEKEEREERDVWEELKNCLVMLPDFFYSQCTVCRRKIAKSSWQRPIDLCSIFVLWLPADPYNFCSKITICF